jgi:hypothetical protein
MDATTREDIAAIAKEVAAEAGLNNFSVSVTADSKHIFDIWFIAKTHRVLVSINTENRESSETLKHEIQDQLRKSLQAGLAQREPPSPS